MNPLRLVLPIICLCLFWVSGVHALVIDDFAESEFTNGLVARECTGPFSQCFATKAENVASVEGMSREHMYSVITGPVDANNQPINMTANVNTSNETFNIANTLSFINYSLAYDGNADADVSPNPANFNLDLSAGGANALIVSLLFADVDARFNVEIFNGTGAQSATAGVSEISYLSPNVRGRRDLIFYIDDFLADNSMINIAATTALVLNMFLPSGADVSIMKIATARIPEPATYLLLLIGLFGILARNSFVKKLPDKKIIPI